MHASGPPWFTLHLADGTSVGFSAVIDLQVRHTVGDPDEWTVTPWPQATAAEVIREVEHLHQLMTGLDEPQPIRFEGHPLTFQIAEPVVAERQRQPQPGEFGWVRS